MQTNILSNLKANIEQVIPLPDKCNTEYDIEAMTFDLRNKENHLWNDMITVLSTNFTQVT